VIVTWRFGRRDKERLTYLSTYNTNVLSNDQNKKEEEKDASSWTWSLKCRGISSGSR
jgi:hypothetical protein